MWLLERKGGKRKKGGGRGRKGGGVLGSPGLEIAF